MIVRIVAFALALLLSSVAAFAERRVALVIGNAAYEHAAPLQTPVFDAMAVANTLRHLDFEVLLGVDLDRIKTENLIKKYVQSLTGADVALMYYSGHAVQVDNQNHLVPVSANIRSSAELPLETVPLDALFRAMRQNAKIQLIFLDACRNNPFAEQIVAVARQIGGNAVGLAQVPRIGGALIAFSTEPGKVAYDGTGGLSPFTASFVSRAQEPRVEIRQVLTRIRSDVIGATQGAQIPWENSALLSEFYFVPPKPPPFFERFAFIRARSSPDLPAVTLDLRPVRQLEGGAVRIGFDVLPRLGELELDGHRLTTESLITGEEFGRLAYRTGHAGVVSDAFTFTLRDDWGFEGSGSVSVLLTPDREDATIATRPVAALELGRTEARANSILGLGPNLNLADRFIGSKASEIWVRLIQAPAAGLLMQGDQPLKTGRALTLADLPNLAFVPSIGTQGQVSDAVFQLEAPHSGEIVLRIQVEVDACDRLAAFPFDTQGIGEGVPVEQLDAAAARVACEAAVREHPSTARFHGQLGRAYLALRRNTEALHAFERAASLGHVRASAVLGSFFAAGTLVPEDSARARDLYERAAEMGDVVALKALGQLYYDGRGVPRDIAKARENFEKAAQVGYTDAMNSLGRLYSLGEGVGQDATAARRYWEASAERGDVYGINNLGFVYLNGTGVARDSRRALELFQKAASLGHPEAPNNVGNLLILQKNSRDHLAAAAKWYLLGADRGDAWAALNLGNMHRSGRGARLDPVAAARLYARAAGQPRYEPARMAREVVKGLDRGTKVLALRSILRSAGQLVDSLPTEGLASHAAAFAAERGAAPKSDELDEVLIAAAKAEWLALAPRLDTF